MDTEKQLFDLGKIVTTPGAIDFTEGNKISMLRVIDRHASGDWGNMDVHDSRMNDSAVESGEDRIFSSYEFPSGKLWVITEWDRSVTTVLLPDEY